MKKLFFLLSLFFFVISGCRYEKFPEKEGFYVVINNEFTVLPPADESFDIDINTNLIDVNPSPVFYLLNVVSDITLLRLSYINSNAQIQFEVSKRGNQGYLIQLVSPLENGYYCFISREENTFSMVSQQWCFSVGAEQMKAELDLIKQRELSLGLQGVFLPTKDSFQQLNKIQMPEGKVDSSFFDSLPESILSYPMVHLRSSEIDPSKVNLYLIRPLIGVRWGMGSKKDEIYISSTECGAYLGGLSEGDKIVAVDGIEVASADEVKSTLDEVLRYYGQTVLLKVARKAMLFESEVTANCVTSRRIDRMTATVMNDSYLLTLNTHLRSGFVYCLSEDGEAAYCFKMK